MAIGGCIGGPLLNMLLGVGVSTLVSNVRDGTSFAFEVKPIGKLAFGFLAASLTTTAIAVPLSHFRLPKLLCIALPTIYLAFLTLAALSEFGAFKW
jgi:Ca2+/Na+ antiporter